MAVRLNDRRAFAGRGRQSGACSRSSSPNVLVCWDNWCASSSPCSNSGRSDRKTAAQLGSRTTTGVPLRNAGRSAFSVRRSTLGDSQLTGRDPRQPAAHRRQGDLDAEAGIDEYSGGRPGDVWIEVVGECIRPEHHGAQMRALGRRAVSAERIGEPLGRQPGMPRCWSMPPAALGCRQTGVPISAFAARGRSPRPASGRAASPSSSATTGAVGVCSGGAGIPPCRWPCRR